MKANFGELTFHVLRCISLFTPLRRLMRNCEERRRSQDRMLVHQTLSKGWCHARSRLLLGLIVRARGRLVEAQARFGTTESRSSGSAQRSGGPHPDHPRPVAPLQKRARFLALRSRTSALLLPEPLFPEPAQPEGALCGARVARLAAWSGPRAPWCFGGLPCPGHYSHPGHREGEGFSQGAVLRAGHLREERLQDRVGLRVQGGTFCEPGGRDLRLRAGGGSLRREAHRGVSHHRGLSRCLPGRQGLYGRSVGATLVGSLWSPGGGHSQRRLQEGVGEKRPSLGIGKAADHRRGHRPAQGHLRPGASQGQDASRSGGPLGGQDRGLHLRAAAQRSARTTAAPPGRPFGLSGYASLVLGLADIQRSQFALADLPGKTLVVAAEQPSDYIKSTDVLNSIISGEAIKVEQKYKPAHTVIPRAKVLWAMNDLPRVKDAGSGLFRRVKVVPFPRLQVPPNPAVKEAIKEEGPGILVWGLAGLRRLRARGYFEIPEAVREATDEFRKTSDVPAMFVEDACIVSDVERCETQAKVLYDWYKTWCLDNGHKPMSSTAVAKEWRRLGFGKRVLGGRAFYTGIEVDPG